MKTSYNSNILGFRTAAANNWAFYYETCDSFAKFDKLFKYTANETLSKVKIHDLYRFATYSDECLIRDFEYPETTDFAEYRRRFADFLNKHR